MAEDRQQTTVQRHTNPVKEMMVSALKEVGSPEKSTAPWQWVGVHLHTGEGASDAEAKK